MSETAPTVVLIHGAGAGAWCWPSEVLGALEAAGHRVIAPSLSGQDDGATTLTDHVAEATALLEQDDLRDVVLVGHSYGGMVITGVAEAVPDRVARLVFLDAVYPADGEASFDCLPEMAAVLIPMAVDGLVPVLPAEAVGIDTEEQAELVRAHQTTIPLGITQTPVRRTAAQAHIPRTYVLATRSPMGPMADRAKADGVPCYYIDAPHMLMLTAPDQTAELLLDLAAGREPAASFAATA